MQPFGGLLQLCAGQDAGCEAAIHSMHAIFDGHDPEAVLLLDASNAFNNINYKMALKNISIYCPSIFPAFTNIYLQPTYLFVGGDTLQSSEGVMQGDHLAMPMYTLATILLIKKVVTENTKQVWYAGDTTGGGPLESLKQWWDKLPWDLSLDSFVIKSWLAVKPGFFGNARKIFVNTDVNITGYEKRYGSYV